jgi:hypothetical protein
MNGLDLLPPESKWWGVSEPVRGIQWICAAVSNLAADTILMLHITLK